MTFDEINKLAKGSTVGLYYKRRCARPAARERLSRVTGERLRAMAHPERLTPEDVIAVRRAHQHCARGGLKDICDSHEALRADLANVREAWSKDAADREQQRVEAVQREDATRVRNIALVAELDATNAEADQAERERDAATARAEQAEARIQATVDYLRCVVDENSVKKQVLIVLTAPRPVEGSRP